MSSRSHPTAFLAASATIILWAGAFIAIDRAIAQVEPLPLAAVRFAIAGAAALLWLVCARRVRLSRPDVIRTVACGAVGIAFYNVLLAAGQRGIDPGSASFIVSTQPFFTALVARFLFRERWPAALPAGMFIAAAGVALITMPHSVSANADCVLLVLAAAICSGSYFAFQRPLVARHGPATAGAASMLTGGILLLPWLPEGLSAIHGGEVLVAVVYLALGAGIVAYVCWMCALDGLGATRAANLLFLMAPLTTLMSAAIDRSAPPLTTIAGGALALFGVAIGAREKNTSSGGKPCR